jgi:hypothetical protein
MEIAIERVRMWRGPTIPLDLSRLGLTELPELPEGLVELICYHNRLTKLPDKLPASLRYLNCSGNQLTRLPDNLPARLAILYCSHNELTTLPETIPRGLITFACRANRFPDREYDESLWDYVERINAIASRERISQRCAAIFEELAQKVWHPSRVERLMLAGVDMEDM